MSDSDIETVEFLRDRIRELEEKIAVMERERKLRAKEDNVRGDIAQSQEKKDKFDKEFSCV